MSNYNLKSKLGHVIAGITCKNDRYVYNGWIRTTMDKNIANEDLFRYSTMPCELMKFNWDVNNNKQKYCLNHIKCKLYQIENTDNQNVCFHLRAEDVY